MAKKTTLTTDELKAALAERLLAEKRQQQRETTEQHCFVFQHVDLLLKLCPKHERTSCSDENACNSTGDNVHPPRCTRCQLLRIKNNGYNDQFVVDIRLHAVDPVHISGPIVVELPNPNEEEFRGIGGRPS